MRGRDFSYPASIRKDGGTWLVRFRDVPEALTEGESFADALTQAADALEEAIAGRIRREDDIPEATRRQAGELPVPVPPLMASKAALYLAVRERGIGKRELAKRLGVDEKEGRRLLDPKHPTKIQRLHEALQAVGRSLSVRVDERPSAIALRGLGQRPDRRSRPAAMPRRKRAM
jgi:antitoxin HicB